MNATVMASRKAPVIRKIKEGYAASNGMWAVHAPTQEAVTKKFAERREFYEELLARNPIREL